MDKFMYTGKITLSYTKNDKELIKRYYNSGEPAIFKFFAYALAGKDISDLSPNLIRISCQEEESDPIDKLTEQPILKLFYDKVTYADVGEKSNICRLQCNLPLSAISDLTQYKYILEIIAMDSSILARTELDGEPFKYLKSSDQVIIIWDMFVENKSVNNQESESENNQETEQ